MCHSSGTSGLMLPRRRLWDDLPKVVGEGGLPPAIFDPRKRPEDPGQTSTPDPRDRGNEDPRSGGKPNDPRTGGRPDDPRNRGTPTDPRQGGGDDPRARGEDPPVTVGLPADPRTRGVEDPVPYDPRTGGVEVAGDVPRAPLKLVPAMDYLASRDPSLGQALRLSA